MSDHPSDDTLEVSLFGNGNGEALAIHLGNKKWMLVDSFLPRGQSEPVAITYLKSLGVNLETDVKLIVASHWHDDHVKGMSQQIECCSSSELAFSQALESDEFLGIAGLYSNPSITFDRNKSGVKELADSLKSIRARKLTNPDKYRAPIRTLSDHRLYNDDGCEVISLSPSPESIEISTEEIAKIWTSLITEASAANGPRPPRAGIPCPTRNHNAIALWIKKGDQKILLGADLEESGNRLLGWQAVLESKCFPDGKARVFKIPHHGSPNGDYEPTWQHIVDQDNPIAIITAYNKGRRPLPSLDDIERIKTHTKEIFYTSLPVNTANKYEKAVERTIKTVKRRALESPYGHIQLRLNASGEVSITSFGKAGKIKSF